MSKNRLAPALPSTAMARYEPPAPPLPDYEKVAAAFLLGHENPSTRKGYARTLRYWFAWCVERGWDPLYDIKRHEIEFWVRYMQDIESKAPRTVAHHLNGLAGFYRTAEMDGYIDSDPMRFVKRPKIQRKSTTNYVTAPELARMIDLAAKKCVTDWIAWAVPRRRERRVGLQYPQDTEEQVFGIHRLGDVDPRVHGHLWLPVIFAT